MMVRAIDDRSLAEYTHFDPCFPIQCSFAEAFCVIFTVAEEVQPDNVNE
jgi:hypothetical protein